ESSMPSQYAPVRPRSTTRDFLVSGDCRESSERHRAGGALVGVLAIALVVTAFIPNALAADPLASSSLVGTEDPLFENGAWEALTSLSPDGTRFMKSNGAFPDRIVGPGQNHAGARTTAIMPSDHYSEIV